MQPKHVFILVGVLAAAMMLVSACAGAVGPAPAAPEQAPAAAAEPEVKKPPEANDCPSADLDPEWPKEELCWSDMDKNFLSEVLFGDPKQVGESWASVGTYTNKDGEQFTIKVTGKNTVSIGEYTKDLSVCFDLIKLQCPVAKQEGSAVSEVPADDDLWIQFYPMIPEDPTISYVMDFVIDPQISANKSHYYYPQFGQRASVTVSVKYGSGSVNAALCRNSSSPLKKETVKQTGPSTATMEDRVSSGFVPFIVMYTAGVKGVDSSSAYRISGRQGYVGWYKGYYDSPPPGQVVWCRP